MNTLNFTQHESGTYRANIPASPENGTVTIQLSRKQPGYVRVLATIDQSLGPVRIALIGVHAPNFIQQVEKPGGVILVIESESPVVAGAYV